MRNAGRGNVSASQKRERKQTAQSGARARPPPPVCQSVCVSASNSCILRSFSLTTNKQTKKKGAGGSEARALLPLRRDEKRMSWNVNGCDRSSLVRNVFGPQKTLERKRWRAAGEPGRSDGERRRTPERVAVPGGACPQTHRHHCHHRVSAGAVTSRSSRLRGGANMQASVSQPLPRQTGRSGCWL